MVRAAPPVCPAPSSSRPRRERGTIACAEPSAENQDGAPNIIARPGTALKMWFTGRTPCSGTTGMNRALSMETP